MNGPFFQPRIWPTKQQRKPAEAYHHTPPNKHFTSPIQVAPMGFHICMAFGQCTFSCTEPPRTRAESAIANRNSGPHVKAISCERRRKLLGVPNTKWYFRLAPELGLRCFGMLDAHLLEASMSSSTMHLKWCRSSLNRLGKKRVHKASKQSHHQRFDPLIPVPPTPPSSRSRPFGG